METNRSSTALKSLIAVGAISIVLLTIFFMTTKHDADSERAVQYVNAQQAVKASQRAMVLAKANPTPTPQEKALIDASVAAAAAAAAQDQKIR